MSFIVHGQLVVYQNGYTGDTELFRMCFGPMFMYVNGVPLCPLGRWDVAHITARYVGNVYIIAPIKYTKGLVRQQNKTRCISCR
jgi:hypothetical protein